MTANRGRHSSLLLAKLTQRLTNPQENIMERPSVMLKLSVSSHTVLSPGLRKGWKSDFIIMIRVVRRTVKSYEVGKLFWCLSLL